MTPARLLLRSAFPPLLCGGRGQSQTRLPSAELGPRGLSLSRGAASWAHTRAPLFASRQCLPFT